MSIQRKTIGLALLLGTLVAGIGTAQGQNVLPDKYANGNARYGNPNPGAKAPHQPLAPVDFEHDYQPFAPADLSEFGNGPPPRVGFFGSYERLYWSISKPPLATVGSVGAQGIFFDPLSNNDIFAVNSFDTGVFNADAGWGNRYDLGYMENRNHGWLVSIIQGLSQNQTSNNLGGYILFDDPTGLLEGFTDVNDDGFDDDRNLNNVFGRPPFNWDSDDDGEPDANLPIPFPPFPANVPNGDDIIPSDQPGAGTDLGDRVAIATPFDEVQYTNRATMDGVELMRTFRVPRFHDGSDLELWYGVRYLQVKDRMTLLGIGGFLDSTYMNTTITNNIVGPQIGARWSKRLNRWTISTEGRFLAGFNAQSGSQYWVMGSEITQPAFVNGPALTTLTARHSSSGETFAPAGEFRVQASYYFTKAIALKVGYTLLYVDGIQRAADSVDYSVPSFGINRNNTEDYILTNGVNFGIEINR
jgi:hypothetical protein